MFAQTSLTHEQLELLLLLGTILPILGITHPLEITLLFRIIILTFATVAIALLEAAILTLETVAVV